MAYPTRLVKVQPGTLAQALGTDSAALQQLMEFGFHN
jgi:hypothetical protein